MATSSLRGLPSATGDFARGAAELRGRLELVEAESDLLESRLRSSAAKASASSGGPSPADVFVRAASAHARVPALRAEGERLLEEKRRVGESIQRLLLANMLAAERLAGVGGAHPVSDDARGAFTAAATEWDETGGARKGGFSVADVLVAAAAPVEADPVEKAGEEEEGGEEEQQNEDDTTEVVAEESSFVSIEVEADV